jgi:hypothetical protein
MATLIVFAYGKGEFGNSAKSRGPVASATLSRSNGRRNALTEQGNSAAASLIFGAPPLKMNIGSCGYQTFVNYAPH